MNDSIKVNGLFSVKVYNAGDLKHEYTDHNLVVMLGKKNCARLLAGDASGHKITKMQAGTNGAAATLSDTAITNAFTKNISSVTFPNDNQATFNWVLEGDEANDMIIQEFGLVTEDNVLFARKVHLPINKVFPVVVVVSWTITIN